MKSQEMSNQHVIMRYMIAWIVMMFAAIFNAIIREAVYGPFMDSLSAHQLSSVLGVILFGTITWLASSRWPMQTSIQAVIIGLIWVMLTVTFEFTFGMFVMNHPLNYLLHDYNLIAGRVWALVVVTISVLPILVYKFRRRIG